MTLLLDVNMLLAAMWESHPLHERAFAGIKGRSIAVCPLAELGFLRISTNPKAGINAKYQGWVEGDLMTTRLTGSASKSASKPHWLGVK